MAAEHCGSEMPLNWSLKMVCFVLGWFYLDLEKKNCLGEKSKCKYNLFDYSVL